MIAAVIASLQVAPVFAADPVQGRKIVENRAKSACLLCHSGPFLAPHSQGNIGPPLNGVGNRLTQGELRMRIVNPSAANPDTIMPSYGTVGNRNRIGVEWRGKSILSEEEIDDVVAFLATLRDP